jgi:hypothetical protein
MKNINNQLKNTFKKIKFTNSRLVGVERQFYIKNKKRNFSFSANTNGLFD